MNERTIRTAALIGEEAMTVLRNSRVAVFGLGGVGGHAVEALARSGIGTLDLIDSDRVVPSNLNRQIIATEETVGMLKTDAAKKRIRAIDPSVTVYTYPCFYLPSEKERFDFDAWDYIVDAIDTVTAKLDLIEEASRHHVPIISAMGCGNRLDPSKLCVKDIYATSGDPLAKVMRRECRKRGIKKLRVVCSSEKPIPLKIDLKEKEPSARRSIPGSSPFVPSAAGILIASQVVMDLIHYSV